MLATVVLSGCGGKKTTSSTYTTTNSAQAPSTAGAMAPTTGGAMNAAALNCGAVKPVWVNLKSKAYHEAGDPYYGKTAHGQYMCPSAATAAGYHLAGSAGAMGHHRGKSSAGSEYANPTPTP
jgi:hypothetical protein